MEFSKDYHLLLLGKFHAMLDNSVAFMNLNKFQQIYKVQKIQKSWVLFLAQQQVVLEGFLLGLYLILKVSYKDKSFFRCDKDKATSGQKQRNV